MRTNKMDRRYMTKPYRKHKHGRRCRQILMLLVLALAVSGAVFLTNAKKESPAASEMEQTDTNIVEIPEVPGVENSVEEEPSRGEKPEIPAPDDELEEQTDQTEEKAEDLDDTDQTGETSAIDCNVMVPASEAVDLSYFDDAVFIGDSRTEGLFINTGLSNATFFTHQGLTVSEVFTKEVISVGGKKTTVMDALAATSFSKVYIMLGINETGWVYDSIFIEKYGEIIDAIREINPDAVIYVQSILPVTNEVSATHSYIKNERIDTYNQLLQTMAQEKGVYYLNVAEAIAADDGSLPEDAAADGIHLKKEPCQVWLTYLREHTAAEPAPRPEKGTV